MTLKKAAILSRVSTDKQEYERQLDDLKNIARADGYTVPKELIYAEKVSGFSEIEDRVELSRLLTDIREGKNDFKMIYAWEVSRIAREPINILKVVKEATELGVNIHVMGVGKTLNDDGTENTNTALVLGMFAQLAKQEVTTMKARFKSGKRQNAKKGKFTGGNYYPFGYKKTADSYLVIDEKEAAIIRKIFGWSIEGYGCRQIAQMLMQEGIMTRGGLKSWDATVIHQMLKNPLYYGKREYISKTKLKKIKDGSGKERTIRDRTNSDYEYFDLPELAIISKDVFDAANKAVKDRNSAKDRNVRYLYLLNRKVQCGSCGNLYHAKYTMKSQYYMCYNRKFKWEQKLCENAGLGIRLFESIAWTVLKHQPYIIEHLKESQSDLKQVRKDLDKLNKSIDSYTYEIESKNKERKKVLNLILKDVVDEDEGEMLLKGVNNSIKALESKIDLVKEQIKAKKLLMSKADNVDSYMKIIEKIKDDRVAVNEIFNNVLDKIIINSVSPAKKQYVCNQFVFSFFLFGKEKPITVLFDRKANTIQFHKVLEKVISYDEKSILMDDLNDVLDIFKEKRPKGRFGSRYIVVVDKLPFSKMNVLESIEDSKAA